MRKLIMAILATMMMTLSLSANVYNKGKRVKPTQINEWFASNKANKIPMHCTVGKDSKLGEMFVIYDDSGNKYCISNENNDGIGPEIMKYWGKVRDKVRKE